MSSVASSSKMGNNSASIASVASISLSRSVSSRVLACGACLATTLAAGIDSAAAFTTSKAAATPTASPPPGTNDAACSANLEISAGGRADESGVDTGSTAVKAAGAAVKSCSRNALTTEGAGGRTSSLKKSSAHKSVVSVSSDADPLVCASWAEKSSPRNFAIKCASAVLRKPAAN